MKILQIDQLTQAILNELKFSKDVNPKFAEWLSTTVVRWLVRDPKFLATFTTRVMVKRLSLFTDSENPGGSLKFYYLGLDNQPVRVYLDDPYAESDCARGLIHVFLPTRVITHWLYSEHRILLEARDFFDFLLTRRPNEDLRKYTVESLPLQIEAWHAQQRAARIQEVQAVRASSLESCELLHSRALKTEWAQLTEGVDYVQVHKYQDQVWLQLLSPASLDWEAKYKGNCIDGTSYKNRLSCKNTAFISTRRDSDITDAVFTAEVVRVGKTWDVVQFENWGYASTRTDRASDVETLSQKQALKRFVSAVGFNFPGATQQVFSLKVRGDRHE